MTDPEDPWGPELATTGDPDPLQPQKTEMLDRNKIDPSAQTRPSKREDIDAALEFEAEQKTEMLQEKHEDDVAYRLAEVAELPTQFEVPALDRQKLLGLNPALESNTVDDESQESQEVPGLDEVLGVTRAPWESADGAPEPAPRTGPLGGERTTMIPEAQRAEALNFAALDPTSRREIVPQGPPMGLIALGVGVLFLASLGIAALAFGGEEPEAPPVPEAPPTLAEDPAPDPDAPVIAKVPADSPDIPDPVDAPVEPPSDAPADAPSAEPDEPDDEPPPPRAAPDPGWKRKIVGVSLSRATTRLETRLRTTFKNALEADEFARWRVKRGLRRGLKADLALGVVTVKEEAGEVLVEAACSAKADSSWRTLDIMASAKVSTPIPAPPELLDELKRDATSACARRLASSFVYAALKDPPPW